jgi:hypothetical protein
MASLQNISWMCMNWNESSLNRKNIALNLREKGKYGFSFEDKSSTVIAIHFCKNENKRIQNTYRYDNTNGNDRIKSSLHSSQCTKELIFLH